MHIEQYTRTSTRVRWLRKASAGPATRSRSTDTVGRDRAGWTRRETMDGRPALGRTLHDPRGGVGGGFLPPHNPAFTPEEDNRSEINNPVPPGGPPFRGGPRAGHEGVGDRRAVGIPSRRCQGVVDQGQSVGAHSTARLRTYHLRPACVETVDIRHRGRLWAVSADGTTPSNE
jgi:hypothetical protein